MREMHRYCTRMIRMIIITAQCSYASAVLGVGGGDSIGGCGGSASCAGSDGGSAGGVSEDELLSCGSRQCQ